MKLSLAIGVLGVAILSAEASFAQTPAGTEVVAVGCVSRAVTDGSLSGSPGVPPASPNDAARLANSSEPTGAFLLNDAAIPAVAHVPSETSPAPKRSFQLDAKSAEVEPHLGHKVEVTGTIATTSVGAPTGPKTRVDHIQVKSIRMLAEKCDPEPAQ